MKFSPIIRECQRLGLNYFILHRRATGPDEIVDMVKVMVNRARDWENPFGDGTSSGRIIEVLRRKLD